MKTKLATNAVEWVRDEVGAMCYSQSGDCINVPELSLTRLVERRNELESENAKLIKFITECAEDRYARVACREWVRKRKGKHE